MSNPDIISKSTRDTRRDLQNSTLTSNGRADGHAVVDAHLVVVRRANIVGCVHTKLSPHC